MKLSTDRILTTHVGSLPRSDEICAMLIAKQKGELRDAAALDARTKEDVRAVVARQVEAGVDVVSDGEAGKIGYATYIYDRATGFEGDSPRRVPADLQMYPRYMKKIAAAGETARIVRPQCIGPIKWKSREPMMQDIANLKAAMAALRPMDGFLNAASPGVIAVFLPNVYYPSYEAYLAALADVMREEYEAITAAGLTLQIDCPDLAMGRHIRFPEASDAEFVKVAEQNIEALNHALERVPADQVRIHICWGNYEGPHVRDIPVEKILPTVLKAKARAISFEASNPRHAHEWRVFKEARIADDKVLLPGVIDSVSNFVEHPELVAERICRFADIVGRERVLASSDCGFGTFPGMGKVDPDICYAKLKTMAEGAALASSRLWRR
jgi:5-methyltetrahydropteroyltriglutamate--homocysteine methyltransferase